MRALNLDFQPRRRSGPMGWSLLAVGVVLTLGCILVQQHLSDETAQQQGHLQTTQRVLTGDTGGTLLTADYNLAKVAEVKDLKVLNLSELVIALRPEVQPGDGLDANHALVASFVR